MKQILLLICLFSIKINVGICSIIYKDSSIVSNTISVYGENMKLKMDSILDKKSPNINLYDTKSVLTYWVIYSRSALVQQHGERVKIYAYNPEKNTVWLYDVLTDELNNAILVDSIDLSFTNFLVPPILASIHSKHYYQYNTLDEEKYAQFSVFFIIKSGQIIYSIASEHNRYPILNDDKTNYPSKTVNRLIFFPKPHKSDR